MRVQASFSLARIHFELLMHQYVAKTSEDLQYDSSTASNSAFFGYMSSVPSVQGLLMMFGDSMETDCSCLPLLTMFERNVFKLPGSRTVRQTYEQKQRLFLSESYLDIRLVIYKMVINDPLTRRSTKLENSNTASITYAVDLIEVTLNRANVFEFRQNPVAFCLFTITISPTRWPGIRNFRWYVNRPHHPQSDCGRSRDWNRTFCQGEIKPAASSPQCRQYDPWMPHFGTRMTLVVQSGYSRYGGFKIEAAIANVKHDFVTVVAEVLRQILEAGSVLMLHESYAGPTNEPPNERALIDKFSTSAAFPTSAGIFIGRSRSHPYPCVIRPSRFLQALTAHRLECTSWNCILAIAGGSDGEHSLQGSGRGQNGAGHNFQSNRHCDLFRAGYALWF
nr:hypothetical protein CFP56_00620 [Quercus suber]